MPPMFTPSSWLLTKQIEAAMAACDRDRANVLGDRFEAAVAHNKRVVARRRDGDARKHRRAGDAA